VKRRGKLCFVASGGFHDSQTNTRGLDGFNESGDAVRVKAEGGNDAIRQDADIGLAL
jgi:hypothetical protein